MTGTQQVVLFLGLIIFFAIIMNIRPWLRARQERKAVQAWRASGEGSMASYASARRGPRLTAAETDEFAAWHRALSTDCVRLDVTPDVPTGVAGSRIGGSVWLAAGEAWPTDRTGQPLEFLAQIDLADIAATARLADFPDSGLLQFFVGRDDAYGCDFDNPTGGDFRVLFRTSVDAPGALVTQPAMHPDDSTPLSADVRARGRTLALSRTTQRPSWSAHWSLRDRHAIIDRDNGELDAILEDADASMFDVHHVGGYPDFTQVDFRNADCCPDHDVVLLQLWSEPMDAICWGDAGQGNFMISRADLKARDFSRVSYQWDCT